MKGISRAGSGIVAHRGASLLAPENSAEAIRLARTEGADWVEVDVRMTADGALVLAHDESVAGLVVGDSTLDRLRAAARSLATVEEGLEAASGMGVNLELKPPVADAARLLTLVREAVAGFGGPLLVSSFFLPLLARVPAFLPDVDVGVLTAYSYDRDGRMALGHTLDHGYAVALPQDPAVNAGLIAEAHGAGAEVITWTVNSPDRIRELPAWGIDGIITDDPGLAIRVLRG